MKNADKLMGFMRPGRVYRRENLTEASVAVDRDLKTLLVRGLVRKLAGGLYCRAGDAPGTEFPGNREIARAFLKTDNFSLVSRRGHCLIYNRKRGGNFILGGRRFRFRVARAYPKAPGSPGMPARVLERENPRGDLDYWLAKSTVERVAAVEFLRERYYAMCGCKSLPRLARDIRWRDQR
ncbi:MAG: hypothetical protein ACYCPQ_08600 [Elusimicrobiota bacterium]